MAGFPVRVIAAYAGRIITAVHVSTICHAITVVVSTVTAGLFSRFVEDARNSFLALSISGVTDPFTVRISITGSLVQKIGTGKNITSIGYIITGFSCLTRVSSSLAGASTITGLFTVAVFAIWAGCSGRGVSTVCITAACGGTVSSAVVTVLSGILCSVSTKPRLVTTFCSLVAAFSCRTGITGGITISLSIAILDSIAEESVVAKTVVGDVGAGAVRFVALVHRAGDAIIAIDQYTRLAGTGDTGLRTVACKPVIAIGRRAASDASIAQKRLDFLVVEGECSIHRSVEDTIALVINIVTAGSAELTNDLGFVIQNRRAAASTLGGPDDIATVNALAAWPRLAGGSARVHYVL